MFSASSKLSAPLLPFWRSGGAHSPLPQFLKGRRVVLLDGKKAPGLDAIANGTALPFPDRAFDVVVSTDVLEHVAEENRETFLNELLRVASQMVIVGFPQNTPEAVRADQQLFEFVRSHQGLDHNFLAEHVEQGLPDAEEVKQILSNNSREVLELDNANVPSWMAMMMSNFLLETAPEFEEARAQLNILFNNRFEAGSHSPPVYRKILVAFHESPKPEVLSRIKSIQSTEPDRGANAYSQAALALTFEFVKALQKEKQELERVEGEVTARESRIKELSTHAGALESTRQELQQQLASQSEDLLRISQELAQKESLLQQKQQENDQQKSVIASQQGRIENLQQYLNLFLQHPAYKVYKFFRRDIKGDRPTEE